MDTNGLSASDVAMLSGDGMNGMGGFFWVFALLILAGGGFGGFGNNNNASETIQRAVDLNSIQQGQAGIAADIQRTTYETMGTIKDSAYNNLSEIRDVQGAMSMGFANVQNTLTGGFAEMQKCCCETQRSIDSVNYNLATQSAAIQANSTANAQKILDVISTNKINDLQNQVNYLQLQIATKA